MATVLPDDRSRNEACPKTTSGEDYASPGRGLSWACLQVLLMGVVLFAGWMSPGRWHQPWTGLAAVLLLCGGAFVGVAGALALGRNRTILPEPPPGAGLVETGIYRRIRHPLYLSVMLLALAWACWRNSLVALAAAVILTGFLAAKAENEEQRLCRRFARYAAYRKRTARFFPGLW